MRTVVSGGARVNLCCLALEPQLLNHFCKLLVLTNIREMLGFTAAVRRYKADKGRARL